MTNANWMNEPRSKSPARVAERNMQLRMAAKGAVSGTAREWPVLKRALLDLGYPVTDHTPANMLRRMATQVVDGGEDWGVEEGQA
jgi:hypothetical protein